MLRPGLKQELLSCDQLPLGSRHTRLFRKYKPNASVERKDGTEYNVAETRLVFYLGNRETQRCAWYSNNWQILWKIGKRYRDYRGGQFWRETWQLSDHAEVEWNLSKSKWSLAFGPQRMTMVYDYNDMREVFQRFDHEPNFPDPINMRKFYCECLQREIDEMIEPPMDLTN